MGLFYNRLQPLQAFRLLSGIAHYPGRLTAFQEPVVHDNRLFMAILPPEIPMPKYPRGCLFGSIVQPLAEISPAPQSHAPKSAGGPGL